MRMPVSRRLSRFMIAHSRKRRISKNEGSSSSRSRRRHLAGCCNPIRRTRRLLKVRAATVCGTDIRILRGRKTKGVRFPSVLGHEFAGEVVEVGAGVSQFSCGDPVSVNPVIPCRKCAYCKTGRENVCQNRQAIGYEFDGAYAEYLKVPALALNPAMPFVSRRGCPSRRRLWQNRWRAASMVCAMSALNLVTWWSSSGQGDWPYACGARAPGRGTTGHRQRA